ncbi:PKD domain-containing protein [Marinoscillum sp. MHG1-6]|uniref:PKD domain-containing protein n=1 Tax=Marinoscillum sp. MHG1-6 TaxID=2959627 RepID=UPI0021579358|nr:PKD domain-containing protein [Marinoscillum sp. MHG1-6]
MSYKNLLGASTAVVLLLLVFGASGQDLTEKNWLFGNSAEYLVFDKSGRSAVLEDDQATPFGTGGSAVISDQYTGDLLFYTDGRQLFDVYHNLITNTLSGDPDLNQAAVACPVPGSSTQYYIFTNSGSSVDYTIVDASSQGNGTVMFPFGDVSGAENISTGISDPAEGMIIIENDNGTSYWLITQNKTSFEFQITNITAGGLSTSNQAIFSGTLPGFETNQFAFNENTNQLALAPKNINRNVLILNFDPAGGTLSFNQSILNTGVTDEIYDVEWSPDGSKLFFSVLGDSSRQGNIHHVDFTDSTSSPLPVNTVVTGSYFRSYGLKRGIDDRIYHLYQLADGSPYTLGRIGDTDSALFLIQYDSLYLNDDFNGTQFPACAPAQMSAFLSVRFDYLDSCEKQATLFFPEVDPEPNSYLWDFGDGNTSNATAPIHTYDAPGNYNVTLTAELNGRFGSFSQLVNIIATDSADLGMDTTICPGSTLDLDPGISGVSYLWSTGETTPTITVDTTDIYWVYVTLASGCTTYDEIAVTVYGETEMFGDIWYFGENAGLDFSFGAPIPIYDANLMSSPEGCASIIDINGRLAFYTDGNTVWNSSHAIMVNGTNLGGDNTAAQSALIKAHPIDPTLFFIFTTEEVYGDGTYQLKYSVVDMKADNALGQVIKKGVTLISQSTERVASSSTDRNYPYVFGHEFGNNNFRVYLVDENGVSAALHSSIGEPHRKDIEPSQTGYMKVSGMNKVATVIPGSTDYLEVFDFDPFTGAIENPTLLDLMLGGSESPYGIEFSPNGENIFVSADGGGTGKLLAYDVSNPDSASFTRYEYPSGGLSGYGALQIGSDGIIYLAIDNQTDLGSITGGDNALPGPVFTETAGLALNDGGGRMSRRGLPGSGVPQPPVLLPEITVATACAGQETFFSGIGRDNSIEYYQWDFGDGVTTPLSQSIDTSHVYDSAGIYIVNLLLSLAPECEPDTLLTDTIEVFSIPELPLVPTDTALCGGTVTLEAWDVDRTDLHYYWSTGDTTRIVTFTQPMIVSVAIYNDDGCPSDTMDVFIGDGANLVDLGPSEMIVCQNDGSPTLDGSTINSTYQWYLDGILIGENATQDVFTSTAGIFMYRVAVTNQFTGCTAMDSVEVTVLPEPAVLQANIVNPECSQSNGSFQLEFPNGGNYSYEMTGPVNAGPFTFDGPGVTPTLDNLSSGSYIITATNTVTGCQNIEVMLLEDNADFDMEAVAENDCFEGGDIRIILRNYAGSRVDVEVLDEFGDVIYSELNRRATNIRVNDLDTGIYYVTTRHVVDPYCLQADTVVLQNGVECFRTIVAPNAFSPNGNGLNDEFFAYPNDYIERFEIFIYNRWGQIVFNAKDKNFRWDGSFGNQLSPPGTYAYKMVFHSSLEPEAGQLVQYGSVTLIR